MLFSATIVVLGLIIFEVISSIDNAIINAHVLKTMPEKYRRIFLIWGIFFAVIVVRGILPFVIIWLANSSIPILEVFTVAFTGSEADIEKYLEHSKPLLLLGGGLYLFFVSLGWLFLEDKKYAFSPERWIHRRGFWFYAIASLALTLVVYFAVKIDPWLALSASIGASAFFITDGFKKNAEEKEKAMLDPNMSAWSKILYLEILDASFSIDGVIGAFAFTLSIPLILIGNGVGAIVVRQVTVKGIDTVSKFVYLKNGAMYSIGVLGMMMMLESFGKEYPFWLAPFNTSALLVIFMVMSYREIRKTKPLA